MNALPEKHEAEEPESFCWKLHILMMDGKPFKCSTDLGEMNHFKDQYSLDMGGVKFTLTDIGADHIHMNPPVGTRVTGSKGTVVEFRPFIDSEGKANVGWFNVES